jgi:hypothetical protein
VSLEGRRESYEARRLAKESDDTGERPRNAKEDGKLLASRLAYHLRCMAEDATDPELSSRQRLALVQDRVKRIREIRRDLER